MTESVQEPTFSKINLLLTFWMHFGSFGSPLAPFWLPLAPFWLIFSQICTLFCKLSVKFGIDFRKCVFSNNIWQQSHKGTNEQATKPTSHKRTSIFNPWPLQGSIFGRPKGSAGHAKRTAFHRKTCRRASAALYIRDLNALSRIKSFISKKIAVLLTLLTNTSSSTSVAFATEFA